MDGSGETLDVGVPLVDQFPLISPFYMRLLLEDEGTKADDESEFISVGGPLSIAGGCESDGVTFEKVYGRAGLISRTETAFNRAGLPIC